MIFKTARPLVTILGFFLSACGVGVGQFGDARLTLTTERAAGACKVFAYISPPDQQFATNGIQATINGGPAWVIQAVAAHDKYHFYNTTNPSWVHVPASALTIWSENPHLPVSAPLAAFLDLEIFDGYTRILVRAANPCALDALDFEGPTRTASLGTTSRPAFRAGETITLTSDERGSWGTEPVPFTLDYASKTSGTGSRNVTVLAQPEGNRLSMVVPELGLTQPANADLITTRRTSVPAFEKCEGLAGCDYVASTGVATVKWILEP